MPCLSKPSSSVSTHVKISAGRRKNLLSISAEMRSKCPLKSSSLVSKSKQRAFHPPPPPPHTAEVVTCSQVPSGGWKAARDPRQGVANMWHTHNSSIHPPFFLSLQIRFEVLRGRDCLSLRCSFSD